jgi:hypothetical protein
MGVAAASARSSARLAVRTIPATCGGFYKPKFEFLPQFGPEDPDLGPPRAPLPESYRTSQDTATLPLFHHSIVLEPLSISIKLLCHIVPLLSNMPAHRHNLRSAGLLSLPGLRDVRHSSSPSPLRSRERSRTVDGCLSESSSCTSFVPVANSSHLQHSCFSGAYVIVFFAYSVLMLLFNVGDASHVVASITEFILDAELRSGLNSIPSQLSQRDLPCSSQRDEFSLLHRSACVVATTHGLLPPNSVPQWLELMPHC